MRKETVKIMAITQCNNLVSIKLDLKLKLPVQIYHSLVSLFMVISASIIYFLFSERGKKDYSINSTNSEMFTLLLQND